MEPFFKNGESAGENLWNVSRLFCWTCTGLYTVFAERNLTSFPNISVLVTSLSEARIYMPSLHVCILVCICFGSFCLDQFLEAQTHMLPLSLFISWFQKRGFSWLLSNGKLNAVLLHVSATDARHPQNWVQEEESSSAQRIFPTISWSMMVHLRLVSRAIYFKGELRRMTARGWLICKRRRGGVGWRASVVLPKN